MSSEEFNHFKVQFKDIASATNNFDQEKNIGSGGFGPVYKGDLSLPQGRITMAFKRLDPKFGQGSGEFWKEIIMLSKYRHENLVSLLCFCDDGDERILGYEFASRGSLDRYLGDHVNLSWTERLKICIGVARALNYLHDPKESQERVLHLDIKSSNILLDEKWTAKVSDFGLSKLMAANKPESSKFVSSNQPESSIFTNAVGTQGYCDPLYLELGFLTKESDVYSLGVVLFEVMCGRSIFDFRNGVFRGILVTEWKTRYDEKKLDDIVSSNLKKQMESGSLMTFSAIARRCLRENRKERPTMSEIVKELQAALEKQKFPQISTRRLVALGKLAEPPLSYKSEEELLLMLSEGFRYMDTTWLSANKNGSTCEMISAKKCIIDRGTEGFQVIQSEDSRFDYVVQNTRDFRIQVSPQFLVPHVTYIVNLIFKVTEWNHSEYGAPFRYRLDEKVSCGPCNVELREDGWLITQLFQFTSHQQKQHFIIECLCMTSVGHHVLEGIEFHPVEYEMEEKNEVNIQSISNTDTDWEQNFPIDYIDLIKLSKETLQWTTKKDLYFLLRQGFHIDNGEKWLSVNKNMKKRLMIPPRAAFYEEWTWKSFPKSRFEVVAESPNRWTFRVKCEINSQLLSPDTTYSCHLIYKLVKTDSLRVCIISYLSIYDCPRYIYLIAPKTPIIPLDTHNIKGLPKLRKDGWMECEFWKVSTGTTGSIHISLEFSSGNSFSGFVVQGIEFRPL